MTLTELIRLGHDKVRRAVWQDPDDYLQLHLTQLGDEWAVGPWADLYAPVQEKLGYARPQRIWLMDGEDSTSTDWSPYAGTWDGQPSPLEATEVDP